jgi:hypothetical protein
MLYLRLGGKITDNGVTSRKADLSKPDITCQTLNSLNIINITAIKFEL